MKNDRSKRSTACKNKWCPFCLWNRAVNFTRGLIINNARVKKPELTQQEKWDLTAEAVRKAVRRANRQAVAALRKPLPEPIGLRKFFLLELSEQAQAHGHYPRRFYINPHSLKVLQGECSPEELWVRSGVNGQPDLWFFHGVELCIHPDYYLPIGETVSGDMYVL